MNAETGLAFGALGVAALGVVVPALTAALSARTQRRAAHEAWLRDKRLENYEAAMQGLIRHKTGMLYEDSDYGRVLRRTVLLCSNRARYSLGIVTSRHSDEDLKEEASARLIQALREDLLGPHPSEPSRRERWDRDYLKKREPQANDGHPEGL